jgi:opacity protein-like surface antigen
VRIKSIIWAGTTPLLALASPPALAQEGDALDLPCYYAQPVQKDVNSLWWLHNFYLAGKFGATRTNIDDIQNVSNVTNPPTTTTSEASSTNLQGGAALGYQIRCSGIFSRIEIEYMNKGEVPYNPSPVLTFAVPPPLPTITLNSDVEIHTLLFKIFYDIDLGHQIYPYVQIGAGAAFEKVNSDGTFTDVGSPITVVTSTSQTKTNFAADIGAGVHIKYTKHLFSDIGYEFDYLGGNLQWVIDTSTNNSTTPITLESGNVFANTITFSLGWVI